jgi:hypothetical protein
VAANSSLAGATDALVCSWQVPHVLTPPLHTLLAHHENVPVIQANYQPVGCSAGAPVMASADRRHVRPPPRAQLQALHQSFRDHYVREAALKREVLDYGETARAGGATPFTRLTARRTTADFLLAVYEQDTISDAELR